VDAKWLLIQQTHGEVFSEECFGDSKLQIGFYTTLVKKKIVNIFVDFFVILGRVCSESA
jgi:hypothetical protein